ncbi:MULTISPECIES: amino acid ABC transporter ATP-binding protein [Hungatella]|uniref:ATP-binding cassette domain-containing protein n=1 Tax=Hungatella hathewayi TaxID=154046 RepID=A0AAW9WQQ5_9FIRM|nr:MULTISPECIES: amino acid ABC transporter ATP-binding protein [Hungatella]MCQ4832572.1 amino acid ABC transporter ATP-binding protein [Hungatella sp. SL.1.14]MUB66702.1 ATP-binding cassette domain-containing protein [Hungatella hathewayi]CUQ57224.1 L-cystine import ATP-binding protein TcyN [Hungatella hathewayi]
MIEVKNWKKSFGDNQVIKGVDYRVETGDVVAIIGASGSGKSTFLRTLNFLERAEKGVLKLEDITLDMSDKISRKEILDVRRNTAMVFQGFNLFSHRTALENVMEALVVVKKMKKEEAKKIAAEEIARVGLKDRMNYYPHQLSGGQQQRVGIARALALNPRVILFDEPTSALDPEMVGEVLDVIRSISHQGTTLMIVTHEMAFAREVADRVVFFSDGVILEEGPAKEFFANPRHERTKQFIQRINKH